MALKRKIEKSTWEKLSDEMKPLYAEKDGAYELDVEGGDEDAGELRRANDRLKQEAKDAKKALKELQDAAGEGEEADAKKRGDIEKLEKSWKDKNEALKTEYEGKLAAKDKYIRDSMLDSAAKDVAAIAKSPSILMPHVKSRLDIDLTGEVPKVRVLDKDGKPSSLTIDELKKEFVANKDFSDIIVASKASGGATKANGQQESGASKTHTDTTKPLSSVSPDDLVAHLRAKKEASGES